MKLTKSQIRKIIKEELATTLSEVEGGLPTEDEANEMLEHLLKVKYSLSNDFPELWAKEGFYKSEGPKTLGYFLENAIDMILNARHSSSLRSKKST